VGRRQKENALLGVVDHPSSHPSTGAPAAKRRKTADGKSSSSQQLEEGGVDLQGSSTPIVHINTSGKSTYECRVCNKVMGQKYMWQRHWRTHTQEKAHACRDCQMQFREYSHLSRHVKMQHTGETNFQCKTCNRFFSDNNALKIHQNTHERDRWHKCRSSGCEHKFLGAEELKQHVVSHMTGSSDVVCPTCGKKCSCERALKRHTASHNKKHACNTCGKKFRDATALRAHSHKA
jgi:KRAB domain-containing zinc finger protein